MLVKVADDSDECDQELKSAIQMPDNDQIASSRIKTFTSYTKRLGEQWIEAGNTKYGRPKIGSVPFFLSFFWQVQNKDVWPVYYTNTVNTMSDLNIWQPSGELAEDYLQYKKIHEELAEYYASVTKKAFDLYQVEHVFWFKGGNPYLETSIGETTVIEKRKTGPHDAEVKIIFYERLPESYVPPIVAILPEIAKNNE
jgi:hypothetical protein